MTRLYNNTEIIMSSFIFTKGNSYDSKKAFSESLFVDNTMFSQQEIMTIFKEYFNVILENKNISLTAESKKTYTSQKNNVTKEQALDFLNKLSVFLQEKTSMVQEVFEDDIKKLWNENTNEQTIDEAVKSWPKHLQQELEGNVAIELNRLIDESITKTKKEFPNVSPTKLDTMKKNLSNNHRKKIKIMLQEAKKIGQREIKEFIKLKLFPRKTILLKATGNPLEINNPQKFFEAFMEIKTFFGNRIKLYFKPVSKKKRRLKKISLPEKEKPPKRRKSNVTNEIENPLLKALEKNKENIPIPSNTQKALKRLMEAKSKVEREPKQGPKPPKNSATPSGK